MVGFQLQIWPFWTILLASKPRTISILTTLRVSGPPKCVLLSCDVPLLPTPSPKRKKAQRLPIATVPVIFAGMGVHQTRKDVCAWDLNPLPCAAKVTRGPTPEVGDAHRLCSSGRIKQPPHTEPHANLGLAGHTIHTHGCKAYSRLVNCRRG